MMSVWRWNRLQSIWDEWRQPEISNLQPWTAEVFPGALWLRIRCESLHIVIVISTHECSMSVLARSGCERKT
jgi:hypothetical protein